MKKPGRATIAAHPPEGAETPTRPIAPPLTTASVYRFGDLDTLLSASRGEKAAQTFYRRYGHPNGRMVEETVAALEGAEDALACSAGMAAVATIFQTLLKRGDRVLAARDLYGGTYAYLDTFMNRLGVEVEFSDLRQIEQGVPEGVRLVVVETISNPLIRVADLAAIARHAKKAGATLVVDNTFATPVLCRPLEWGADVVFHSGTKFLNGHGDATSGVIVGKADVIKAMRKLTILAGGVISPLDAWLTSRGIKTLGLRVERASRNAAALAKFLSRHRKVGHVNYPKANRYLKPLLGPMLSFEVKGGLKAADRFVRACRLIELVPSLGDVTTTSSHPARSSHAYLSPAARAAMGVTDGLIRISTGIEDVNDILEDLTQALTKV
ncbi:MAG: aminotransferase class I/II-fold pyridoxal phosphate-dependent enzyme [Planctomycetaceae bacterium]|nr:aminotransferase class I/II-fold pyridoxal phosphate-dependent enzyme [Planctomycetaceae bacterium]